MHYSSLKTHLKPFSIVMKRRTTINHAFAAAIAPSDPFDDARIREALALLGQNPDDPLRCAYCDAPAETWDHIHATVAKTQFSGHGHRLGNLLPCCKPCNSKKGGKPWRAFLESREIPPAVKAERIERIAAYIQRYMIVDPLPEHSSEYAELLRLRLQVLDIFKRADALAEIIRNKNHPPVNP